MPATKALRRYIAQHGGLPDESKKEDALYTREKEVAELEALIPEIKEKITDTNEMKAESLRKMREAVGFPAGKIIHCCTACGWKPALSGAF